jgi:hypothetical protein
MSKGLMYGGDTTGALASSTNPLVCALNKLTCFDMNNLEMRMEHWESAVWNPQLLHTGLWNSTKVLGQKNINY